MKKLMISFFLFVFSVPAFSWGLLFYMDKMPGFTTPGYKGFVLYELVKQAQASRKGVATLDVCVDLDPQAKHRYMADKRTGQVADNADQVAAYLVNTLQTSFDTWLGQTRQALQPRRKEFADVLAALPTQVQLNWVNKDGPYEKCPQSPTTLIIYGRAMNEAYGNIMEKGHASPSNLRGDNWSVTVPATKQLAKEIYYEHLIDIGSPDAKPFSSVDMPITEAVMLHETGHFFGLADQYQIFQDYNLDLNGNEPTNSHLSYSLYKALGANYFQTNSIMREGNGGRFSYDDEEGLINAVDLILRNESNAPSKRLQYGWAELGNRGFLYIDGLPVQVTAEQKAQFQEWVKKGYKENQKPAFASTVAKEQAKAQQDLSDYMTSFYKIKDEYNDLNTRIDSLNLELKHSQLSNKEKQQKQQQLAALTKRLNEIEPLYQNLTGDFEHNLAIYGKTLGQDTLEALNRYKRISSPSDTAPVIDPSKAVVPSSLKGQQAQPVRTLPADLDTRRGIAVAGGVTGGQTPSISPVYNPTRPQAQPVATLTLEGNVVLPSRAAVGQEVPSVYRTPDGPVWYAQNPQPAGVSAADNVLPPSQPQRQAAPAKVCDVCGKAVEGSSYYTDSVGRHVHKGGECAYKYFARFHKTDNKSLASYDDYYFLNQPQAVTVAKADMKKLGITTAGIRSYLKNEREKQKAARAQQQVGKQMQALTQKTLEQKCSSYHVVTKADLNAYLKDNSLVLNTATRKRKAGQKLGKKEEKILNAYYALLADYQTTQFCQNLAQQ